MKKYSFTNGETEFTVYTDDVYDARLKDDRMQRTCFGKRCSLKLIRVEEVMEEKKWVSH